MKILHVTGSMDPITGGPCQAIRNMVPELEKQGVYSEVLCADDNDELDYQEDPFIMHALGPALSSWHYSRKIAGWLNSNIPRFDIIIVHGCWLYPGYAAFHSWQKLKSRHRLAPFGSLPRLYFMPHGMLDPYFQNAPDRMMKAARNWLYWKVIEARMINQADGLLFTSQQESSVAGQSFQPYKPKKRLNIGLGVTDAPDFCETMRTAFNQKYPHLEGKPYFLFFSRIHQKKGVDILLKAYQQLKFMDANFPELVIAGPGLHSDYGDQMLGLVADSVVLTDHVTFTGMLAGDLKWAALYGCEALVLPSHQENFGIAIAEALACGRPVIISDKVNIHREILDGDCGLVGNDTCEDTQRIWLTFNQLRDDEKRQMGLRARETFQRQFAMDRAVTEMIGQLSQARVILGP
ncbi:glycosyltransferase [Dyadobacter sp. CY326]|uniref:glycosyltransferase n=1 Tax=Dyadobacter sp. CY326 TaxID=2907300 RepID=UPI001F1FA815|nr:glycosyltransferase [Dyadobacter sp. CY326]MCE7066138.1 glycosyltransferase [Dyadobacter sp. CY326]